jgi:hypothetical protein
MPPESLRAEAARRGTTVYAVRAERARARGYTGYRQERHARPEELRRRQEVRRKRTEERPWLPEPGDFPMYSEEEPHGLRGPFFGQAPDSDWDYRNPTNTSNPPRPRTLEARYSRQDQRLEVIFRDGTTWHYDQVPPVVWYRFRDNESPGKYINAVLNGYPYAAGGFGTVLTPSTGGLDGGDAAGEET